MYAIIGLGNPGKKYDKTRHNVGFMTIDCLADHFATKINKAKFNAMYGEVNYKGEKILLVKPQTFMNDSGICVRQIMDYYNIDIEKVIIIVDDIDIDFGRVRVKAKGSAGTHNGLRSIVGHIGDTNFPRIKISVGKKPLYMDLATFVLSTFSSQELNILHKELEQAKKACLEIIDGGVDFAMNSTNSIRFE